MKQRPTGRRSTPRSPPVDAANFRIFADMIKTAPMESFRTDLPGGAHAINYTVRKPLGVVGIISPWNLPLLLNGVFNLVHGFGPDCAGEFITTSPDIDAITFTGELRTGSAIMRAAAEHVKPISFELGGKNAAIIFADCDFDKAVDGMMRAIYLNSGQVCLCAERVFVEREGGMHSLTSIPS